VPRKVSAISELTWPAVIARRLARHHLLEPASPERIVDVVSDICGVHAQVAASAELMVGLRVREVTRQDIRSALWRERTLVKTVGLRGTLHLFRADEVPLWMAANRLSADAVEKRLERVGISPDELRATVREIGAIVGPQPISRKELEGELEARLGGWTTATNQGWMGTHKNWPMALGWAAALGLVCYGPGDGGRITFVRLSDWSGWREVDPEEGGRFALRRFLHAYGPSTQAEFGRWFAAAPALVKRMFESLADELIEVNVSDEKRWSLRADAGDFDDASDAVHLLPHFDVFVVGAHPRNQLMDPASPVAIASPGTAAPFAVVLRGGRVAGVWERRPKGKRLRVRVDAYWSLKRKHRAEIETQAARIGTILERDVEVEFGNVDLRPHAEESGSFSTDTGRPSNEEMTRREVSGSPLVQNLSCPAPLRARSPRSSSTRESCRATAAPVSTRVTFGPAISASSGFRNT
jgi:Winged helix DNA-binding domain